MTGPEANPGASPTDRSPAVSVKRSVAPPPLDPAERRPLGSTGLPVGPLCFGTAPLGNMPEVFAFGVPEDRALATVRAFLDSPIGFVDTAAIYGDGESERRIGIALAERGGVPDGVIVATKADRERASGAYDAAQMRRSVEDSRRRLGLDHLPLVYLHDPEYARARFEETVGPGGAVRALLDLREAGVIGHVGIAGGPVDLLARYVDTGFFEVLLTHNRYTLLDRSARRLIERAVEAGMAVVNGAPYGSGILAKGSVAYRRYGYREAEPALIERVEGIERLCARYDIPIAAAALQFSYRNPLISSTVVGMTSPERVAATLRLAQTPIPDAFWPEAEEFAFAEDDPRIDRW